MERKHLPFQIESERLWLKKVDAAHAQAQFDYIDQDRVRLAEFLPWIPHIKTVEDEHKFILQTQACWAEFKRFDYGLFRQTDGEYLGNIGVHSISWSNDCCELGYWILGKYEGQGYVSEAVSALENMLFTEGFHRIEIRCDPLNARSAGVPKRCGYALEGHLREDSLADSGYRDTLVFGKINS
ncbi:GNAT family protein [Bdellovibrionota bacterium FG-2]